MYDPSAMTPPQQASGYPQYQTPPMWAPYCAYPPGAVIWYAGTYWRCEAGHTSGTEPGGAPVNNLHLWTPVSSISQPPQGSFGAAATPAQAYGYNPICAPTNFASSSSSSSSNPSSAIASGMANLPIPPPQYQAQAPPQSGPHTKPPDIKHEDSSDSNSSDETVTASRSQFHSHPSTSQFFASKASESLRYLAMREEEHKARDKDELKDELKGKRVWRIGGIGVWSYSLEEEVERNKMEVWKSWGEKHGRGEWVEGAKERTRVYNKESKGIKPLIMWKFVEKGSDLPPDALAIGHESDGQLLYAVRSWFEGGLHLGKSAARRDNSASLSYGGTEHLIQEYEVLCGPSDPSVLKWMNFRHGERAGVHGWLPVEGGREKDGLALLIAKGEYDNGQHPGKCLIGDDHACIGWGGGELWIRPFQVLAYNDAGRR